MLTPDDYAALESSKRMWNINPVFSPDREHNEDKASRAGSLSCICCGKAVKATRAKWVLCVNGSHDHIGDPAEEEFWETNDGGFMGCYVVGSSCASKMSKVLGVPKSWFFNLED